MILLAVLPWVIWPGINDSALPPLPRYLLVIILGICASKEKWFEKINKTYGFIAIVACIGFAFIRKYYGYASITEAALTVSICIIVYFFISKIKIINRVLEVLGKHSMNMFLTHSFVMAYSLNEFTYSFKYPELILLVLILDTLVISWIIEKEKEIILKLKNKCRSIRIGESKCKY